MWCVLEKEGERERGVKDERPNFSVTGGKEKGTSQFDALPIVHTFSVALLRLIISVLSNSLSGWDTAS